MKVILITGIIGSGKDFYCKEYVKNHPDERVKVMKFAASLRDITEGIYNLPKGDETAYEAFKAIPENRMFMVRLGQNLKRVYGNDFLALKVANDIVDLNGEYDTVIITDFRFPVEFWTLNYALTPLGYKISILFADYHSDRYTIAPDQVSEQMAIWLKEQGLKDRDGMGRREFMFLLKKYQER